MYWQNKQNLFWQKSIKAAVVAALLGLSGGELLATGTHPSSLLSIKITGIKKQKGSVRIAVFGDKESWLRKPVFTAVLPATAKALNFTKEQVPYGEYGIAIFHDRNDDGEMDRNFLGIPKEPYGFSNDARGSFGPAKWKKAKVTVSEPETLLSIKIK